MFDPCIGCRGKRGGLSDLSHFSVTATGAAEDGWAEIGKDRAGENSQSLIQSDPAFLSAKMSDDKLQHTHTHIHTYSATSHHVISESVFNLITLNHAWSSEGESGLLWQSMCCVTATGFPEHRPAAYFNTHTHTHTVAWNTHDKDVCGETGQAKSWTDKEWSQPDRTARQIGWLIVWVISISLTCEQTHIGLRLPRPIRFGLWNRTRKCFVCTSSGFFDSVFTCGQTKPVRLEANAWMGSHISHVDKKWLSLSIVENRFWQEQKATLKSSFCVVVGINISDKGATCKHFCSKHSKMWYN